MLMKALEQAYDAIHDAIATTKGGLEYSELSSRFVELCELLTTELEKNDQTESIWYIGEFNDFTLADLIIGAFWHYSDYYLGQNSESYQALCMLGDLYSPGNALAPEPESGEQTAYKLLNELAERASKGTTGKAKE